MRKTLLPARRSPPGGFTIIELLITLTLVAILIALAAPSMREAMMSIRITSHTNDLMGDLAIARSEAVKRNVRMVLCASIDGATCADGANWNQGWIVFPDVDADGAQDGGVPEEETLKSHAALKGEPTIGLSCVGAANKRITYRPTGMSSAASAVFTICDSRTTTNAGRTITINQTGRVVSARGTCPITATCP